MKYSGEMTMSGDLEALDVHFVPHNGVGKVDPAPFVPSLRLLSDLGDLGEYGTRTLRISVEIEVEEEEYE